MRNVCLAVLLVVTALAFFALRAADEGGPHASSIGGKRFESAQAPAAASMRPMELPLSFEANQGQADGQVRFLARSQDYSVFVTPAATVLTMARAPKGGRERQRRIAVRMRLVGANQHPIVEGLDPTSTRSNYFFGRDPARWRTNVPHYARVRLHNVYPGVDEVLHPEGRQLEYDFVVSPRAEPLRIRMAFEGIDAMRVNDAGSLILDTGAGVIEQRAPSVYQEIDGVRHQVAGRYAVAASREVGFEIPAYDHTRPLVIDPVVLYSTYLGGDGSDGVSATATDSAGSVYVTGTTASTDFPTVNALQEARNGDRPDAFVAKIDSTGTRLLYATYFGGSDSDGGSGIAIDASGNAYVTGSTRSADFPTRNAVQPNRGGDNDAFIVKLNPGGSAVVYATYLGGSGADDVSAIAVDSDGRAHVTGRTQSTNFPVVNALQPAKRGLSLVYDAFVSTLEASGASLVYSTYLGGTGHDGGNGIAVDAAGNAYVAGNTASQDFPTLNARQPSYGGGVGDGFVAKISPGGTLLYATYLGGSDSDGLTAIAVTSQGRAYVTGSTWSIDFPAVNAHKATNGQPTAFKSTDGGRSWRPLALNNLRVSSFAVDRVNPSTVYVGAAQGIFKSTDGGDQWTRLDTGFPSVEVEAVAVDPFATGTVYAGTALNNLLKSTDGGRTWTKLVVDTSPRATVFTLALDPLHSQTMYAGSYSALARTQNGGATWAYAGTDKAGAIAVDPSNPSIVYAGRTGDGSDDGRGGIFKSTDGGATWASIWRRPIPPGPKDRDPSVTALVVDPRATSTVYVVTGSGAFKSTTGGDEWTAMNNGLPTPLSGLLVIDPLNSSTLYLGTYGGVFKTSDGGATWTAPSNGLFKQSITALAVSPTEPGVVYAAIPGGTSDAFLTSLSPDGSSLLSSTYLGGGGNDDGTGVAIDARGNVYVTGSTASNNFPTVDAFQATPGGNSDAFVAAFNGAGSTLLYASYLGGGSDDRGSGIAADPAGNVVVTGTTSSTNFPLTRPLRGRGKLTDGFVVRIGATASAAGAGGSITSMMAPGVPSASFDRAHVSQVFATRDGVRYQVDAVATGLDSPSAIAFAPDGRLFVAERPGRVRIFDSALRASSMALILDDVFADGDAGLLGFALDPDFAHTRFVYLYYTARARDGATNRVVRYREVDARLAERVVLLDGIPGNTRRNGGALRFGPDDLLYVATGDAGVPSLSQDLASLAGKILRLNRDGTTPRDNPFASPVFSSGYNDPHGLDWDPSTGELWSDDAGHVGSAELSIVSPGMHRPLALFESAVVPLGASFARARRIAAFENDLFVATLGGHGLLRIRRDGSSSRRIVGREWLEAGGGGVRDVIVGPDGLLYVVSSNNPGDGAQSLDYVSRIVPR